jgi:hypothetical protein
MINSVLGKALLEFQIALMPVTLKTLNCGGTRGVSEVSKGVVYYVDFGWFG